MNKCIVCGRVLEEKLIEFSNMPRAAQNMPDKNDLAKEKGITLSLYECPGCGVIQFDAPPVEYYRDVIRATKVSEKFHKLRKKQYEHFIDLFGLKNKTILEVGCGAGEFLEIWKDYPVHATGIEHNTNLVKIAYNQKLDVIEGYIESENDILKGAPFDAFVSFNFLEHQPNPNGMLRGIYENLTEDGVGLITVPSFEYFQENGCYYEFLRDHIVYYTKDSIERVLQLNGFEVVESTIFNQDTLEVLVRKRKKTKLTDYLGQKKRLEIAVNKYLSQVEGKIYVWGASHQAFTLLSTLHFSSKIDGVIDSAAFKWGKYTPASHIPIFSPDILSSITPNCIIIMAPGFSDEIFNQILSLNPNVENIITIKDGEVYVLRWGKI